MAESSSFSPSTVAEIQQILTSPSHRRFVDQSPVETPGTSINELSLSER